MYMHCVFLFFSNNIGISMQVSAHAMNNMGPTAQIISRGDWKTDIDFVGHRKAVTCVVSPNIFLSRSQTSIILWAQLAPFLSCICIQ